MPQVVINGKTLRFVWVVPGSSGGVGQPEETFLVDNTRATAQIRCAYDKRFDVIDAMVGYSWVERVGVKNVLKRLPAFEYPSKKGLFCVGSLRGEGISPYGPAPVRTILSPIPVGGVRLPIPIPSYGQPEYIDGKITLLFTNLPYNVKPDGPYNTVGGVTFPDNTDASWRPYPDEGEALRRGIAFSRNVSRTARAAGKYITLPGNVLFYKNNGVPVPGAQGTFFHPALDLLYTWHNVPETALPISAWLSIPGSINDAAFDGWPAQTLLCENPTFRKTTTPFGIAQYDVQYTFKFLPNYERLTVGGVTTEYYRGHNWFPAIGTTEDSFPGLNRKGLRVYKEVCTRGTTGTVATPAGPRPLVPMNGSPPHNLADFRNLFRPDQS